MKIIKGKIEEAFVHKENEKLKILIKSIEGEEIPQTQTVTTTKIEEFIKKGE
jgi:hypothetical protein